MPGPNSNGNGGYPDPNRIPGHFPPEHERRMQQGLPGGGGGLPAYQPGQPLPWLTNPAMLREIFARGPGSYRLQVTIPSGAQPGQQAPYYHQTPQAYPPAMQPQHQPMLYPPSMAYYPMVQPPYPGEVDPRVAGVQRPAVWQSVYQGEVHNPDRPPVTMVHTGRADGSMVDGTSKKKARKRKRANPRAPKPARYAWNFFFKEKYQQLRKDGGDGLFDVQEAFTKVGLRLGNKWKKLSVEERKPYVEMAAKDRQRYEREMELFNKGLDFRTLNKENDEKRVKTEDSEKEQETKSSEETKDHAIKSEAPESSPESKLTDIDKTTDIEHQSESTTDDTKTNSTIVPAPVEATIDPNVAHQVTADILVTDDDDTFIVMMEATLKRLHKDLNGKVNLNIHKAKSGTEALAKVVEEQQKYLVITMDKEMGPDSPDGYQTVKKIRESGYNGFVLGLTGDPDCEKSFETNGADATLTKGSSKLYSQIYGYVIEKLNNA